MLAVAHRNFLHHRRFQRLDGFAAPARRRFALRHRHNIHLPDARPQQRQQRKQHNQPRTPFRRGGKRRFGQLQMGGEESQLVRIALGRVELVADSPHIAPNGAVAAEKIAEGNKADKAGHGGTVIKEKRKTETKRRKQTNARTERILAENGLSVKREGSIRDGNTNGKTAEPVSRRKGYLKNNGIPNPNRPRQPCPPTTGCLKIFQVACMDVGRHHTPQARDKNRYAQPAV